MQPKLKLYIKVFIIAGLLYAISMSIADYLGGDPFSSAKFLISALIFGGAMSLTLVSMHISSLKEQGVPNPSDEDLKAIQRAEFTSKVSQDEFVSKLSTHEELSKMKLQSNEDGVTLKTGITWRSWGETLAIKITPNSTQEYTYHVSSKPKLPLTLTDFGKNLKNIKLIRELT